MASAEQEINALALIIRTTIQRIAKQSTFNGLLGGVTFSERDLARSLVDAGYTLSEKTNELALRDLRERTTALVDKWEREDAEHDATMREADVRCLDCNLRYAERQEYSCIIEGTGHSYSQGELDEARALKIEPTWHSAELRAVLEADQWNPTVTPDGEVVA